MLILRDLRIQGFQSKGAIDCIIPPVADATPLYWYASVLAHMSRDMLVALILRRRVRGAVLQGWSSAEAAEKADAWPRPVPTDHRYAALTHPAEGRTTRGAFQFMSVRSPVAPSQVSRHSSFAGTASTRPACYDRRTAFHPDISEIPSDSR